MASAHRTEIAIIGAGVVGLAVAERLLAEGREVTLIDPNEAGSGASYGNAGTIADYAVMPVGTPDVLRNLPSLLLNRNSPLAIRHAALPSLLPWLIRFARQSLPAPAARNAAAIAALLAGAAPLWRELAARIGGTDILQERGCLYLYETESGFQAAKSDMAGRRALGIAVDLLTPGELAQMEPALPPVAGGAAFFPQAVFMNDPGAMVRKLAGSLSAPHLRVSVTGLERGVDGIRLTGADATGHAHTIHARRVILAAGAHSRALARMAGDNIPLDTERGYHVEWDLEQPRLSRPTCPTTRGFYLCPMAGRLRVAGTVELGGLTLPPSPHRIKRLIQGAQAIFPDLPDTPTRDWMGFRPSLPDSLPVIGPSAGGADVIHAFGHGHIGLTLAPVTARLVADIIAGRAPQRDITATRANRF